MAWTPMFNTEESKSFAKKFIFLPYTNLDKPVDTFFVIGGLLAAWSLLNAFEKFVFFRESKTKTWVSFYTFIRNSVNIPRMYLHRYLRYTPALALMILIYTSLTKFMGSGPYFNPKIENCQKYWWTSLLHVSVYTNPKQIVSFDSKSFSLIFSLTFHFFVLSAMTSRGTSQ